MYVTAGSWLIASVCMVLMTQRSSTMRAVYGKSSLTWVPARPWRAKRNFDGASGKRACPLDMVVSRCPMRTDSGRSRSKNSFMRGL